MNRSFQIQQAKILDWLKHSKPNENYREYQNRIKVNDG